MPLQDYKGKKYRYEWYKRTGSVGIKQKFGEKVQIWSFGSKSGMSEENLRKMAVECVKKLDAGKKPDDVRTWVLAQCRQ